MYKIMLVEDEPAILHAMTDTINWNALSFHTPVACANGQAAIEEIENGFIPHAVITDICMPFVDGIALTEYLSKHCPQTLVVLLTGYDDFDYAHRAIRLKVFDYVLKPITPKSLCSLAAHLCGELENRRIKKADEFDALAKERFFTNLLAAQLDEKTIQDNFRVHGLLDTAPYWRVVAVDLNLPTAVTAKQNQDNELTRYGMNNIVTELAQELPGTMICMPVNEALCVVLNGETPQALMDTARLLSQRVEEGCERIGQKATCGVGKAVSSPAKLHDSYLQAVLALNYRFFVGVVPFIPGEEIDVQSTPEFNYSDYAHQFTAALKRVNREKTLAVVDAFFDHMQVEKLPFPQCMRYCQRMVLYLLERMGEYLSADEMARLESTWDNANFFATASTLEQLHNMLTELCTFSFDSFARVQEDDSTLRVRKAEAYIREHYSDDTLSLNTIRDVFSISVSYFSVIFKAGTGYTFVEYLTQVRIEKAKELLALTERRTSEIAAEVGFADPHYFSIAFKRATGMTPRGYRAQIRCTQ